MVAKDNREDDLPKDANAKSPRRPEIFPRYMEVANQLIGDIEKGVYPVGSTLPTEHELCDLHNISRFTAREALRQLREAGLVTRKPRAGTQVIAREAKPQFAQSLTTIDDLMQYATNTELRLVFTGTGVIDKVLADEVGLDPAEERFIAVGIRYRQDDDKPICITRVYYSNELKDMARHLRKRDSTFYQLICRVYGLTVARVEQQIQAVTLSRDDALHLRTKPRSPALRMLRRYYFNPGGRMLMASDSLHPSDRFTYSMTLTQP